MLPILNQGEILSVLYERPALAASGTVTLPSFSVLDGQMGSAALNAGRLSVCQLKGWRFAGVLRFATATSARVQLQGSNDRSTWYDIVQASGAGSAMNDGGRILTLTETVFTFAFGQLIITNTDGVNGGAFAFAGALVP